MALGKTRPQKNITGVKPGQTVYLATGATIKAIRRKYPRSNIWIGEIVEPSAKDKAAGKRTGDSCTFCDVNVLKCI